jgi:hypothetical protein
MNRRMYIAAVAATAGGGVLTAAFLQAAVALAAPDTEPGADAFTIDGTTFDPVTSTGAEGFTPVLPILLAPPLLTVGGSTEHLSPVIELAPQSFDVYSGTGSSATDLGSVDTDETVASLLGLPDTEFTVLDSTPAAGVDASALPATGTVYDVLNLGNGTYNVYTATPDVGSTSGTVADTLVTPSGNVNLDSLFGGINAANPLQPGDAFTGLQAGDSGIGADAFTIGSTTFDPVTTAGPEGFDPVSSLGSVPPLVNLGGGTLLGIALAPQDFDVYSGTGSSATEVGSITTAVDATHLLGLPNTELIVQSVTPAAGADTSQLPAVGTVYDAFNLGNGWENVYTATPDVGSTSGTVTDTLVTPFGNVDLSSLLGGINAANPLQPGDAFIGLQAGDSGIGADAFTLGSYTFDPFTGSGASTAEGFAPVPAFIGAAPGLDIAVGQVQKYGTSPLDVNLQDFDVYSGTGSSATDLGAIHASEAVTNLFGLTNTEFTVLDSTPATGVDASALPATGTVYDAFSLGSGWENVYIATPDVGSTSGTVTDTLVTPFGNVDLSSLLSGINAANPLDAGDAVAGLDDAASAAASDPLAFLGL